MTKPLPLSWQPHDSVPSLTALWEVHTREMKNAPRDTVLPGIYMDCQQTAFDEAGKPVRAMFDFLKAAQEKYGRPVNLISLDITAVPFVLMAHDIEDDEIALKSKQMLRRMLEKDRLRLEMLIDDDTDPHTRLPALTSLHPQQLLRLIPGE